MGKPGYSIWQLILYFLKLGSIGFGGPVALTGYMHRDLVEDKKWISEQDFKEGITLAQLMPGPLATQLAIYLGYVDYKFVGATLVGLAFVLPSFIIVVLLGAVYVYYNGLPVMQSLFYGVSAAVIGIIAISSYRLTNKTIGKDKFLWLIFIVLAIATFITKSENIYLILGAGFLTIIVRVYPFKKNIPVSVFLPFFYPSVFLQAVTVSMADNQLWKIFFFFAKAGTFVFGSGLAIVPFLYGGVVKEYHWLTEKQFLDAVAVAMITPGPVVITVGFIGYIVAGIKGAILAAFGVFFPCYVFTVLPAPYFKKIAKNMYIKAFVDGVTAAAIGAIAGAVGILALRSIVDIPTAFIAIASGIVLYKFKKIQEPHIVLIAAVAGVVIKTFLH
ncbi:MAG: chrA [Bacteroidota bacterium]|nr:chrA [Bacteroidota bacterium]